MSDLADVENWHIPHVAKNMRDIDKREILASSATTPFQCLEKSVAISDYCKAVIVNDKPIAILGLVVKSNGTGIPWLLGTDEIACHKKPFYTQSKIALDEMKSLCSRMENYVFSENTASIRFLRHLGFTINPPSSFGASGEAFNRFVFGEFNV